MNTLKFVRSETMRSLQNISTYIIVRNVSLDHVKHVQRTEKGNQSTINTDEIHLFKSIGDQWWNLKGHLSGLHSMNPVRVQFVRDGLANVGNVAGSPSQPLEGVKVVDIGCGGGILSEALARIGADVTGVDASPDLIAIAKKHAALDKNISKNLNYVCTSVEDLCTTSKEKYDAVVASEVIEHVDNQKIFLDCCVKLLKPGGSLFITTPNRTYFSFLTVIVAAEYVTRQLPRGTHSWSKFISPTEVQCMLETYNCKTRLIHGLVYNPIKIEWSWCSSTFLHYALHAVKQK